jgi:TatA/E family protein of Tat protein translocase
MLSIPHLVVIFLVALVIFGPQKLPELARNLGRIVGEFRRATNDLRGTFEEHMRELERETQMIDQKKRDLMRVQAEVNSTLEEAKAVQATTAAQVAAATQHDSNLPPALPAGASLADTFPIEDFDPLLADTGASENTIHNPDKGRNLNEGQNPNKGNVPEASLSKTSASQQEHAPAENGQPPTVAENAVPAIPGTVPSKRPNDVPQNNQLTSKPAEDPAQDDVHVS